jgi:putative hydrolase of the HAD superfamily
MTNQVFSAALFDMDDTLIDRRSAYGDVYRVIYDKYESISSAASWEDALEYFWTLSPDNATAPRDAFIAIQNKWPGVGGDPDAHYNFYYEHMVKFMKALPGAVDFVDWMNASEVNWGIVTNGGQFQHQKAVATGLDKKSPFVLASLLFGVNKPAPEVFMEAVRLLNIDGLKTEDILFVGDNPYTDILGAHGVGMKTAWIRMDREKFPDDAPVPDFIIDHVEELKALLS